MPPQTSDPVPAPGGSRHRLDPAEPFRITDHDTSASGPYASEDEAGPVLEELLERLAELTDRLGAEAANAILVVLQGFDGAGKDHVISHVLTAIDPSLLHVFSFNTPVGDEVDHDFLWRFHQQTPARGRVHAFDRSYYEEVIGARVHDVVTEQACRARYESINDFERLLARDGTVVLKFFLHIDKDVQAERVRERLRERSKQHEFSAADVQDRDLWDEYDRAYEDALNATGTDVAPWHVVPADERWYACTAVAEALVSALEALDPQYPPLDEDEVREAGLDPAGFDTGAR
jgi:PPK2 family polyphosphate:nucleotide phosphotransferase